ncbi:uncharacterized protein LOC112523413 isoform X1 [Cynara cardunculus var. scolymus]|nr:uncharacterized protein LOC112523413 isoform X1 [Cynara cardunculus var. scolymus]
MAKGSSRFSSATRQTEGGDSDGILHKSPKKLKKLSSMAEMNQSSQSTSTTTSSKRVKLPKKFFDDYDTVNHTSVPRKLRSAMKKRQYESVSPSSPNNKNRVRKFEMDSEDRNRKLKVGVDEQHPTISESNAEKITKDEEEAMAALVAMAGIIPGNDNSTEDINLKNETSAAEASNLQEKSDSKTGGSPAASKPKDLVQESVQIEDLNEIRNTFSVKKDSKDVTDGNKLRKRCSSHVYICQFIKDLQFAEGKLVNSVQERKQRAYTDAKTDKIPENVTNGNADKISNKTSTENRTIFQDQRQVQNHSAAASGQVPVLPLFGSPLYDPSQWARPLFPKQSMWMSPLIPGARYQNWPNGGCETMPPGSNSYGRMSAGSNYAQSSLLDTGKTPQQLQYKTQFGHRSSGFDESGGLFLVDRSPTLKLTLQ